MRCCRVLSLLATATAVVAHPFTNDGPAPKVQPNDVDILGGDFGLANTRPKVELYNMLAGIFATGGNGKSGKDALTTLVDSLVTKNGVTEMYEGFGGDELVRWIESQFAYWTVGTDSYDPNTFICRAFERDSLLSPIFNRLIGSPTRPGESCKRDYSAGRGPYPANYTVDPTLPSRTIFAPVNKPENISMPVIIWGGCIASGSMYANFLTEVASHGYFVITTGVPDQSLGGTQVSDMTKNIDWVTRNDAALKYGNIDRTKIIAAGHSCGGLEALSASYRDPRVAMTMVFNSGVADGWTRKKIDLLSKPVAYFVGANKNDFAYYGATADFARAKVPALFASLRDTSNLGTFFIEKGGKEAEAAVAYLDWKTRGDDSKKAMFCPNAAPNSGKTKAVSPLASQGWTLKDKNGMC